MDKATVEARLESRRRNGHKRHSGVYGSSGQSGQTWKGDKGDRNGPIHPNDITQTVRAVTPDPPLATDIPRPASALGVRSTSRGTSPRRAVRRNLRQASDTTAQTRDVTPKSGSEVLAPSIADLKAAHQRPRTRTLEERFRDKSPPLLLKHRHRVDSLQATTVKDFVEDTSSIGFPSIIPSPPLEPESQSNRRRLAKPPPRPLSPIRNSSTAKRGLPQPSPATDAAKILNLMKITCGRMAGVISFRTSSAGSWSSGYCAINVGPGSLIYQNIKGDVSHAKTLISDLRGCQVRTLYDGGTRSTFLDVSPRGATTGIHLRPHVPEAFDSWLAALLCWQPIRPKGVQNKMTKPQEPVISERRLGDRRRNSAITSPKDVAIIKVGKIKMWNKYARSDTSTPLSSSRGSTHNLTRPNPWQRVSCTLQENGHFKLYTESDVSLLTMISLSTLSRCSIQRLDPSVLDDEFSLAIYPQYTSTTDSLPAHGTVYLSMESRALFEVWFVLLRAFTVPDLYGPEQIPTDPKLGQAKPSSDTSTVAVADMFRVERILSLRITEAKLYTTKGKHSQGSGHAHHKSPARRDSVPGNYYAEVRLDGEIRAKTAVKTETSNPFWREEFDFTDLPPVLSSASIHLRMRNPGQIDWTLIPDSAAEHVHEDINPLSISGNIELSPLDLTYGKFDLRLDDLERATDTERWWPVFNDADDVVGEILMKVRIEELVVLAGQDYAPLSELLHAFSNGLTNQIAQRAHAELRRLSEIMLNIFQVSAQASDWIMSLVEDEIDNIHKESPISRFRYGHRIASNDSVESGVEREVLVRDLGKSATIEANLLFRGNSLLTKALDLHMRRLGKEYLEETLNERMRDINESDPECEVDPNRVQNAEDLERNWRNLIALTETVWKAIAASASRCPSELRMIFRHIRACAEDRYGDFLRTVTYSSVSGFLFLRFFCPAVLNPKLFDLLKG